LEILGRPLNDILFSREFRKSHKLLSRRYDRTEGMHKLPRPVRNLLTGGVLLTPSGIFTFVGCLEPEMSWVERQATIWEKLQHESRPESPPFNATALDPSTTIATDSS
jgi:hypothetical protein